jgi:hypothetical protein
MSIREQQFEIFFQHFLIDCPFEITEEEHTEQLREALHESMKRSGLLKEDEPSSQPVKKILTGYNLFTKAKCDEAKEKGEKISFKEIGQLWKQLKETGGEDEWNQKAKEVVPKGQKKKKQVNGYNLFTQAKFAEAKKNGEKTSFKEIGQMWKQLKEIGGQDEWNQKAQIAQIN